MNRLFACLTCWLLLTDSQVFSADPAWPGHHPLTQAQVGHVLVTEFRCAACHAGIAPSHIPEKTAPDLSKVGARVSPKYLRRFLVSPSEAHPGTTMPDLLVTKTDVERDQIAEGLTHFLVAQSKEVFASSSPEPIDRQLGKSLFHSVGCVACHGTNEASAENVSTQEHEEDDDENDERAKARAAKKAIKPIALPLGHVAAKYSVKSLGEFLFQPLHVRSSGRMPDMKLTLAESLAIAGYLVGEQQSEEVFVPDAKLVAKGGSDFLALRCNSCHLLPGVASEPHIASLRGADLSRGCLSKTSVRSPRFSLDDHQIAAIATYLREEWIEDSDTTVVAKTLTTFHCNACHVRDNFGGVHDSHNSFFQGSDLKLGDDGRIPPPLTLVGAKLQPTWMKKVLFDGESVRPYMATRMPQYGAANLHHLPAILSRLDVLAGRTITIPSPENRKEEDREEEKRIRSAGRELLGDKGLNCVACHSFNGKASAGNQGIDLLTSFPRLQPGWFDRYLRNPAAFRPRTVMPSSWPNGEATHKTILDGNTDKQIDAIWYYLSLGTSAADPSGIRGANTKLTVGSQAFTYRGRSRVAGFRGIAVGLPEKVSYAFNAETGTMSAIWQGDFIGVNWSGQGAGDFHPSGEPIGLAQDVSFASLPDDEAPWPMMPIMTKESKVNPNPLYPKNVGYQFRGYYLDQMSIPTFMYRSGSVEIEDRTEAAGAELNRQLRRVFKLTAPTTQTIWFRALVGDISNESDRVYQNGRIRLTIPQTEARLRVQSDEPKQSELLLPLRLPQGQSTFEFLYEPIKK